MSLGIALAGTAFLVWIIICIAFVYFAFIGWEGIITALVGHSIGWLAVVLAILILLMGLFSPFIGAINFLVGIYGIILLLT